MSELRNVLAKLHGEVAECRALSNLTNDPEKRKLFATVAERLAELASAVEDELALISAGMMHEVGQKPADTIVVADAGEHQAGTSWSFRKRPWFPIVGLAAFTVVLLAAGAAFVTGGEKDLVTPVEAKIVAPAAPEQDTKQMMAEFQAAEENRRKLLSQQLDALAARVDSFETTRNENLEKARAEVVEPTPKSDGERLRKPRKTLSNSRTVRPGWGF